MAVEMPRWVDDGPAVKVVRTARVAQDRARGIFDQQPWRPTDFDLDEETRALIAALAELDQRDDAFEGKHKRGPGGVFATMVGRIINAIEEHQKSGGKGDPLAGFTRPQLLKAAKARGFTVARGAPDDHIKKALIDDLSPEVGKTTPAMKNVPAKPEVAKPKAPAKKALPKAPAAQKALPKAPAKKALPKAKKVTFDAKAAKTYSPVTQVKHAKVMPAPEGHKTTIVPEWGGEQSFVGPWVAVFNDKGEVAYGSAHKEWMDMHERVPGQKDGWQKTATVDAYQHAGSDAPFTTVLADGTVETTNTIHAGDWIVQQKNGEVQIIRDDKFRKLYDAAKPAKKKRSFVNLDGTTIELDPDETLRLLPKKKGGFGYAIIATKPLPGGDGRYGPEREVEQRKPRNYTSLQAHKRLAELLALVGDAEDDDGQPAVPKAPAKKARALDADSAQLVARGILDASWRPTEARLFNPKQLRDPRGRWVRVGAEMHELWQRAEAGGFTYNSTSHTHVSTGFALSPYPERSRVIKAADFTPDVLHQYRADNADVLSQPGHYLGAWREHTDEVDQIWLDVSIVSQDRDEAERIGRQFDQVAMYDLGAGEEINLGGAGGLDGARAAGRDGAWGRHRRGTRPAIRGPDVRRHPDEHAAGWSELRKFNPLEPRDPHGRWSPIAAARKALAEATTIDEVNAAAAAGAKAITGRDVRFQFRLGVPQFLQPRPERDDVELARDHVEGIFQGMEQVPNTNLELVYSGHIQHHPEAYAMTSRDGRVIQFNDEWEPATYRTSLLSDERGNHLAVGSPVGNALHEYGHSVAQSHDLNDGVSQVAWDYVAENMPQFSGTQGAVARDISRYAATNSHELAAEAFADVSYYGERSSGLAHAIHDFLVTSANGATRAALLAPESRKFNPLEARDPHGRWSLAGIAKKLADAKTIDEVNTVSEDAAQAITGNHIVFELDEPLPLAREHAGGILAGLKRYPKVKLVAVGMDPTDFDGMASTSTARADGRSVVQFSTPALTVYGGEAGYRALIDQGAVRGDSVVTKPADVATHEFGHVVAGSYQLEDRAVDRAQRYAQAHGTTAEALARGFTAYGSSAPSEFVAEAFADVMINGAQAQPVSKAVVRGMNADIKELDADPSLATWMMPPIRSAEVPLETTGIEYHSGRSQP